MGHHPVNGETQLNKPFGDDITRKLDEAFEREFGKGFAKEKKPDKPQPRPSPPNLPAQEKLAKAAEAWAKKSHPGTLKDYPPHIEDEDEQSIRAAFEKNGLALEKPQGSSLHHALDELRSRGVPQATTDFFAQEFQSFVIQHDWAKAFDHATDFEGGEVRLPFDFTAFEFRITGQRVIVALGNGGSEAKDAIIGVMFTGVNGRWYMPATNLLFVDGKLIDEDSDALQDYSYGVEFLGLLGRQIRAVCIVLEAEVAETEVVRAPRALQEKRQRDGKTPMKDYHVVSLAHRHRVKALEQHMPSDRKRPRCHYRRGHWRHFGTHRTWIKWMLVGNPDLGFVDKEYRL